MIVADDNLDDVIKLATYLFTYETHPDILNKTPTPKSMNLPSNSEINQKSV